jgi:hypothetical protein
LNVIESKSEMNFYWIVLCGFIGFIGLCGFIGFNTKDTKETNLKIMIILNQRYVIAISDRKKKHGMFF